MIRVALVVMVAIAFAGRVVTGEDLFGTIVLPDGTAARHAKVTAAAMFFRPALRRETMTDESGNFHLDLQPLSGAERWSVCARLGRLGGEANDSFGTVRVTAGQNPLPVTIRLEERGELRGRVLEAEDDEPVAGAQLFLDTGEVVTT